MSAEISNPFSHGICFFEAGGVQFPAHKQFIVWTSPKLAGMIAKASSAYRFDHLSSVPPIKIDDTTEATFVRFLEFAYTGDYNAAIPQRPPNSCEDRNEATRKDGAAPCTADFAEQLSSLSLEANTLREYLAGSGKRRFIDSVHNRSGEMPLMTGSMLTYGMHENLNYLPVFLSHAELYVFAYTYGALTLQELAAERFEQALNSYDSWQEDAMNECTDLAALVSWVYGHTDDSDDELRAIVVNFCSDHRDGLGKSKSFRALVESGASFATDLSLRGTLRT